MVRRSKRASLSLSVEAIVILVLAITMLGLGISFTKGIFDKFKVNYEIDLPNPTDAAPIEMPPGEMEISISGTRFPVKFKNIGIVDVILPPLVACDWENTGVISTVDQYITTKALGVTVAPGDVAEYKVIIPKGSSANKIDTTRVGNTYACVVQFYDGTSLTSPGNIVVEKQFIANVIS
jgi:hypothetical protein